MRVLGIDPGSLVTGYGCVEATRAGRGGADAALVEGGVIRLSRSAALGDRLVQLHADLRGLIANLRPGLIAIETLFVHHQRPSAVIVMGHARGVILLAARQAGVAVVELRPAEVKKATAASGRAGKGQMQRAVAQDLGLSEAPRPADVADALAVALCALRRWR